MFRALKNGQIEALGILYDRHADTVYGLALKLLANSQKAEDITQEVLLPLYHRDIYDPTRGSLISFLLTMTRSRSIDLIACDRTALS